MHEERKKIRTLHQPHNCSYLVFGVTVNNFVLKYNKSSNFIFPFEKIPPRKYQLQDRAGVYNKNRLPLKSTGNLNVKGKERELK